MAIELSGIVLGAPLKSVVAIPPATYSDTDGVIYRPFNNLTMRAVTLEINQTNLVGTLQHVRYTVQVFDPSRPTTWGVILTETIDEYAPMGVCTIKIAPGMSPVHRYSYNDWLPARFRIVAQVRFAGTVDLQVAAHFSSH